MNSPPSPPRPPTGKLPAVDLTESVAGEEDPGASLDLPLRPPGSADGGCPTCGGSGKIASGTCPDCQGMGKVPAGTGTP